MSRRIREGQRDVATVVASSVVVLITWVFQMQPPPEVTAAMISLMTILAHRWSPDLASRNSDE